MKNLRELIFTILGPALFALCYFFLRESVFVEPAARAALGTLAWMAVWWITGLFDFAVTAFLPIALNAVFQMADMSSVIEAHLHSCYSCWLWLAAVVYVQKGSRIHNCGCYSDERYELSDALLLACFQYCVSAVNSKVHCSLQIVLNKYRIAPLV